VTTKGVNPFNFTKPVPADQLIDREKELDQLARLAEGGHNSRLTAPRRYGKTTLIRALRRQMDDEGMATVYVNFYGLLSVEEAASRIEQAYRGSLHGALRNYVVGAIRTVRPTLTIPGTGASVTLDFQETEIGRRLTWLLNLPQRILQKQGIRTLVIFDEFQDVLRTKPPLDGLIRSVLEQHEDEASYIFAGSHPGMMTELFGDRQRPFYGQARALVLPPLPNEALATYIGKHFSATGREVGDALDPLLAAARGHPQRAMVLAHLVWEHTDKGESADEVTWQTALQDSYLEVRDELMEVWNGLSDQERRTVAAVASASGAFLSKRALEAFQLPRSTAIDARDRLLKEGLLEGGEEEPRLVDPLMEVWIRHGRQGLTEPITSSEEL
jgi:AAA+ ATPase superfamily predicted ATPase